MSVTYTRYADDMVFSSNKEDDLIGNNSICIFDGDKLLLSEKFGEIFSRNGFQINERKTVLLNNNQRMCVTGLIINQKVNVTKNFIKDLRFKLHLALKYGSEKINVKEILGKVSFMRYIRRKIDINDFLSARYSSELNSLGRAYFPDADFINKFETAKRKYVGLISVNNDSFGSCFFSGGCLITSKHVFEKEGAILNFPLNATITIFITAEAKYNSYSLTVRKPFLQNEMAIVAVDKQLDFSDRELKISSDEYNDCKEVLPIGYISYFDHIQSKVGFVRVVCYNKYFGAKCGILEKSTLQKGMSGGPVLNKFYQVVGVIFTGDDLLCSGDEESLTSIESAYSLINQGMFEQAKKGLS